MDQSQASSIEAFFKTHGLNYTPQLSDVNRGYVNIANDQFRGVIVITGHAWGFEAGIRDYRTSSKIIWEKFGGESLTKEDLKALKARRAEAEERMDETHHRVKGFVQLRLNQWAGLRGESPYLVAKGLPTPAGAIVRPDENSNRLVLVVPMVDSFGEVWNLQQLWHSSAPGNKPLWPGGRMKGLFHVISGANGPSRVLVGEGYATCLAANLASGLTVYCAFNADNMEAVVKVMLERYRPEQIVLLADWDGRTFETKGINKGMVKCRDISLRFGLAISVPARVEGKNIDFADLYAEDVGACKSAIEQLTDGIALTGELLELQPVEPEIVDQADDEPPLPEVSRAPEIEPRPAAPAVIQVSISQKSQPLNERTFPQITVDVSKAQPQFPPEDVMASAMANYFDGYLIKQGKTLFLFDEVIWREMTDEDFLFKAFSKLMQGRGGWTKIKHSVNLFLTKIETAPRNMFEANATKTSFLNGTLVLHDRRRLEFREHRASDYITNLLKVDFDQTQTIRNPVFDETVKNVLGDDAGARRSLAQMYGACLMPAYPRLFMVKGKPGRGKSTLILAAMNLLDGSNVSSVPPSRMDNFHGEAMIGKVVNYDTDIPDNVPITDDVLKKIEDRTPITFNRKFQKVLRALPPPIHIFGCNTLPPTLDRSNGAYSRRWTFILCDQFEAKAGNYNKNRLEEIEAAGAVGIVNFALEGLRDLLSTDGHYTMTDEAKDTLDRWLNDNDVISIFLADIASGDVSQIKLSDEKSMCARSLFWEAFRIWQEDFSPNGKSRITRNKFLTALSEKGLVKSADRHGIRSFRGYSAAKNGK